MTESAVAQFIVEAEPVAAALILLYVVYLFVSGKIHSQSEMDSKNEVIEKLEEMNREVVAQLRQTNDIFERAINHGYTERETNDHHRSSSTPVARDAPRDGPTPNEARDRAEPAARRAGPDG